MHSSSLVHPQHSSKLQQLLPYWCTVPKHPFPCPHESMGIRTWCSPGVKTVRLAKATTSPTLFLAKQRYVPSSVTRTPWICSQPVTSYFWGPPLNYKMGRFLSALVAEARGSLCHRAPGPLFQQTMKSQDCSGSNHAIFCLSPGINKLFLTQLGCSCVCRLLLWCGGLGWRTVVSSNQAG